MFCGGFGRAFAGGALGSGKVGLGFMIIMVLLRVLLLVGIIVLVVKLIRKYTDTSRSALKLLDEAFAKGEINEEEYLKRKNFLTQKK